MLRNPVWGGHFGGQSAKCVIAVGAFKSIFPCTCILLGFGAIFSFTLLCISGGSDACVLYGSEGQGVSFRNSKTAWLGIARWATCGQHAVNMWSTSVGAMQHATNMQSTRGQLAWEAVESSGDFGEFIEVTQ